MGWRRPLALAGIVAMLAVNAAAAVLPLFGRTTGEVSAMYPTLVTPAGFTFSIWGVIYVALLVYGIAQFLPPLRDSSLPDRVAVPLTVANAANAAWLVLWHALLVRFTMVAMAVLLVALAAAYVRANQSEERLPLAARFPLSVYLGWVSVATIVNVAVLLHDLGWDGLGLPPETWTVAVLLVAALIALAFPVRERDYVAPSVFVWALLGIAVARSGEPLVLVAAIVLQVAILVGMAAVGAMDRSRRR